MVNVLTPRGFMPMRNKSAIHGMNNEYTIDPANTQLIGIGDLVRQNTSGHIVKCSPAETPIGFFQGWNFSTRALGGGSQGGAGNDGSVPWKKSWAGAITVPANMAVRALIDDDPLVTLQVQTRGVINASHRGALVDLSDSPGGPDITLFGRSKQKIGFPTTYFNTTAIAVVGGGTGFVQGGVDLLVDGVIETLRPNDITVTAGAVSAITLLNPIHGHEDGTPVITVQAKPGFPGTGPGSFTPTVSGAQTAAQFRIERILEIPFRASDANFNTTGYDLSSPGLFAIVELAFAKHMRGGAALFTAPAA